MTLSVGEIITFPDCPLGIRPSGTHGILILSDLDFKAHLPSLYHKSLHPGKVELSDNSELYFVHKTFYFGVRQITFAGIVATYT